MRAYGMFVVAVLVIVGAVLVARLAGGERTDGLGETVRPIVTALLGWRR